LRGAPALAPFELGVFTREKTARSPAVDALVGEMRAVLGDGPRQPKPRAKG
jgi:hypothetical protein